MESNFSGDPPPFVTNVVAFYWQGYKLSAAGREFLARKAKKWANMKTFWTDKCQVEAESDEENFFLFWWVAEPLDDMLKYKYDYKTKYKYIQYKYSAMKKIWWLAESDAQDVISGPEK